MDSIELLPTDAMAELERLCQRHRKLNRRIVGAIAGSHQSVRRGSSYDFADHRPYGDGDDVRHIDFHAMARLDQVIVRQFDAEEQNTLRLFVDTSGSMGVGGKYRHAASIAAALGFVALVSGDAVSLTTMSHRRATGSQPSRRFVGRHRVAEFVAALEHETVGGSESLHDALRDFSNDPAPGGSAVVLSDFLIEEYENALAVLPHRRRQTLLIQTLHPHELAPVFQGDLELLDVETGERRMVTAESSSLRAYEIRAAAWTASLERRAQSLNVGYRASLVGDDVVRLIVSSLDASRPAAAGTRS